MNKIEVMAGITLVAFAIIMFICGYYVGRSERRRK